MAYITDNAKDAYLDYIVDNVSHIHALNDEPAAWADIASYTCANLACTSSEITGPGDYAGGGRQIAIDELTLNVTATDNVTWVALVDTTGTEILAYVQIASTAVTSGGTLVIPTWLIYIEDPA